MNKKTLFTFGCAVLVCIALFMACEKNTNTTSNTTGTTTTTGSTTGTTAANSMVVDGTAHTVTTGTSTVGNNFVIVSNSTGGYPSISLTFTNTAAPAAGTYTANPSYPASGNCDASVTPSTSITWTVVTCHMNVTSGSSRSVTFNGGTFTDGTNTHTVSVNLPF